MKTAAGLEYNPGWRPWQSNRLHTRAQTERATSPMTASARRAAVRGLSAGFHPVSGHAKVSPLAEGHCHSQNKAKYPFSHSLSPPPPRKSAAFNRSRMRSSRRRHRMRLQQLSRAKLQRSAGCQWWRSISVFSGDTVSCNFQPWQAERYNNYLIHINCARSRLGNRHDTREILPP